MGWPLITGDTSGGWPSIGGASLRDVGFDLMVPTPYGLNHNTVIGISNQSVAANNIVAAVFQAPSAGSVTKIGFLVVSCSANATVDVRLETVGADGNPTGTLVSAGANVNHNITTGMVNAWQEVTLGTAGTVTKGQLIAIVISNTVSAGTFVLGMANNGLQQTQLPFQSVFTASWTKSVTPIVCGMVLGGVWARIPGLYPARAMGGTTFGSTSTPDERGMKITLPFKARAIGLWFCDLATNTSSAFSFKVYDDADTVLVNTVWDADYRSSLNAYGRTLFMFDSAITLEANRAYRATKVPSSTNTVAVQFIDVNDSTIMNALDMGASCVSTSRTDAGAWTDTATTRILMGWILDQVAY